MVNLQVSAQRAHSNPPRREALRGGIRVVSERRYEHAVHPDAPVLPALIPDLGVAGPHAGAAVASPGSAHLGWSVAIIG